MVDYAMNHVWLIPLMPLIAFTLIVFVFFRMPRASAAIAITCILISFVLALLVGYGVLQHPELADKPLVYKTTWFQAGDVKIEMGVRLDPVTAMMLFVVTLIASLVQIYSVGYMHGDPGFSRFFAYLSLFAMSMLGLVIAPNLLQMFVFWELVGLCSYLLIGFWYYKYSAREAAKKAFITTRTGDFGLLLGILLIQINFGTLDFSELASKMAHYQDYVSTGFLLAIAGLLFIGPIGKSGQFPLHVWLPDAMEGPTPVSALIHAATMVVAGVYLTGRMLFMFMKVPAAAHLVAWVGGFTALFAATIAITQIEMKKILAYSTISQLGYMMLALGAGSLTASMFHLMTHAFFKALLFLGAGSVLHAMHDEVNIWKYGGLRKKMPVTAWTFVIGALAIAGIPPFAGFWSKDEVLLVTWEAGLYPLFFMALITAFLTAFYMFRMVFICFFGEEKPENHPHEAPLSMQIALWVLGFLSIVGGLVGMPWLEHGFGYYVREPGPVHHAEPSYALMAVSTVIAILGIGLAWLIYNRKVISHEAIAQRFRPIYNLLYNKYYIDELYLWFIHKVIDGLGRVLYWIDINIVDGVVNGVAALARGLGGALRYAETGKLQNYALVLFGAVVVLALILFFSGTSPAAAAAFLLGGGI